MAEVNPVTHTEKVIAKAGGDSTYSAVNAVTHLEHIIEKYGGDGGTDDYSDLSNKPKINNVTLDGNKSWADLGLSNPMHIAGRVDTYRDLPATANEGDVYLVGLVADAEKEEYVYVSGGWEYLGTSAIEVDSAMSTTSENPVQNKVVTAAVNANTEKLTNIDNGGLSHNGIFRGKDLTDVYTVDEMYDMIHSGNFDDLYLGDYFTKNITTDIYTKFGGTEFESGVTYYERSGADLNNWTYAETEDTEYDSSKTYYTKLVKTENVTLMFAAFDYYYNMGDTVLTTHHAILIPRTYGFATAAKMNLTNTTAGGYYGSDMHQITLPCYAKSLKTALGNHLLAHKTWLTTIVNTSTPSMAGAGMTGASSASAWETTELQLMNEVQLYGTMVWSSSAYEVGVDNEKLPVFSFINPVQYGRGSLWLRSVVSSTNFAICNNHGYATNYGASNALYARPLILFG